MIQIDLITVQDIKEYTPISNNYESDKLEPFISLTQFLYLKNVLGDTLYNELQSAISGDTLSGNNYTLLDKYIKPYLMWMVLYEAIPFLRITVKNKGVVLPYSENSNPTTDKEFYSYKQEILDKATGLKQKMLDFLCENSSLYPSYRSEGDSTTSYSGGIFLGK